MAHPRLDEWLVEEGHYATRARAREAIMRGCINMAGGNAVKPSRRVTDPNSVSISDPAQRLVSRAGLKLEAALDTAGISPKGLLALDLGASTGGFCQVLLERGTKRVYAIDVGHDQMNEKISSDPRLVNLEGINARDLEIEHLEGSNPEIITCDVSFISLKLALPPALELAAENAFGLFLVKPQFEVGKDGLGKGGIVRNKETARHAAEGIRDWLNAFPGWSALQLLPSPIPGGDGNTEYLLIGRKNG